MRSSALMLWRQWRTMGCGPCEPPCEVRGRTASRSAGWGSVRRDLLDHVIVLNQRHLRRLMKNYIRYYHEDRRHLGLGKDTPSGRVAASASPIRSKVISLPRLGGLHHRYTAAA